MFVFKLLEELRTTGVAVYDKMGAFVSRQNARVEEVDSNSNNAYKYPPKSGMLDIYK